MGRITIPGRISVVHCMDMPRNGAGIGGYSDFPGDIVRLHEKHGFEMLPRITIWHDPMAVRNRTMMKSLAHRQLCEDSTKITVAPSDFLLLFRKVGENPIPIVHPVGLMEYAGDTKVPKALFKYRGYEGKQTENIYSHFIWQRYASSVWMDIRTTRTLSVEGASDEQDEKHAHPLQLDVIERACVLWSNENEVVLDPFSGVGSTVYGAILNRRKGMGIELKGTYYEQAIRNVEQAIKYKKEPEQPSLF
jgi:DNA modification methylase